MYNVFRIRTHKINFTSNKFSVCETKWKMKFWGKRKRFKKKSIKILRIEKFASSNPSFDVKIFSFEVFLFPLQFNRKNKIKKKKKTLFSCSTLLLKAHVDFPLILLKSRVCIFTFIFWRNFHFTLELM